MEASSVRMNVICEDALEVRNESVVASADAPLADVAPLPGRGRMALYLKHELFGETRFVKPRTGHQTWTSWGGRIHDGGWR